MGDITEARVPVTGRILRKKWDLNKGIFIALLLLPAVAFMGVYMYYPIVETFHLSVMRTTGMDAGEYVGLGNYISLFGNEEFQYGLFHVFAWALLSVGIQVPLAFFTAFSLVAYRNRVTKPLRTIYYMANILPSTITAMLGSFMFTPKSGVIPSLATALKIGWLMKIDFLGDTNLAFFTVFLVATWMYTGFYIIYVMAHIEQIPMEIREAAELDGASGWSYARHIVIPMLSYPITILSVLSVVGSMKVFDLPYLMTRGGPGHSNKTLGIILYNDGFINWQYGKAAAIGVVIFVLSLVFTAVQFSIQSKAGRES